MDSFSTDTSLVKSYEYDLGKKPPEGFGYIYCITNKINGKQYIGQTISSVNRRWASGHCSSKSGCLALANAIKKYGKESFNLEILGVFLEDLLDLAEKAGIRDYNTNAPYGYNLTEGGEGGKKSEETKRKLSEAHKGKKFTKEHIEKMKEIKGIKHWNYGKHLSDETKNKISEAHTGRVNKKPSKETRQKMSEAQKGVKHHAFGKKFSLEHRRRLSESHLINQPRGKNSPFYGKKMSEESKRKNSESHRGDKNPLFGKRHSEETKRRIRIGRRKTEIRKAIKEICDSCP